MDAPERLQARISQLESELAKCRAQTEAQAVEVESAAQALERQYLAQDAALRGIEQERQAAAAEAAANRLDYQKEKEARTKIERELATKTSELEDVLLKAQLLKEQRVSLLDQLEQRKLEQQELKSSLDLYVSKTTTLLEEKLQADRRADEAQLERMRSHGEHSKLQQRVAHLEEQVSFLETENEAKSRALLETQRRAAEEQLASRSQVAELQGQLEAKTSQEAYLTSVVDSKQQLLAEAQAARVEAERAAAAEKLLLESQLAAEKEASAAVKELYESGRERCRTLEETLVQLQTQIEESSTAHAEALQKSEEARQAAEELAEKRREQLEQMVVTPAPGSPGGASPMTPALAPVATRVRTPLRPDPELKVIPLHDGLTVQELYDEYMEMACAYQSEAAKCRQLQNYMDSVCEQLEGRAKVLQRQQDAYNRAVQERAQLAASVQTLQDERRMLEAQAAQAASQLEGAVRRATVMEQQNADATRQVEVLLAEMERLHGRPVPTVPPVPRKTPGIISAEDVINDKLVAFTNLPELLDQHKQMRAMIRSLVDELETTRSSAREEASRIVAERQAQLDSAMAAVASDQQRLQEALEVVAGQQDHYKQALATATAEIEKLRGTPGGGERAELGGAPAPLALEGPVGASARQELEELRQQLESVRQKSAQELGAVRQQLAEAQVKVAEVKAELAAATAAQQHAEARIQDLLAHAEVLKQQRTENLQERQRLQQALNIAELRLREAQASLAEKAEELFQARTKIAELEQDVARERRAESEASQKLFKLHADSRNEAVELRYQLGLAAARQESLSRETKEAKEKVIALEAEVGRLNSELLQEKSKLSTLKESDVLRIQSSFGLVKQFKEENSNMKAKVEEYESKIKSQEKQREVLQSAHDRLEEKVGLLEKELLESKETITTMTSDHSQVVKGQQEELAQLRLEIKTKQEVADLGKKQLEAARQEVAFYQLAASTAGSDAATVKADLETRTAELADVKGRLEAAQKATTEVQQALDKLREESQTKTSKLQEDLSNLKLQYQSTQQQLGARDAELREAKQQLEFMEASHNLDKEALQQAQEKLTTAERQIDELAASLGAAQKHRVTLQDKVTLLEQTHTSEVRSLQQSLQDLQLQAATYRLQSEKMTQDVMATVNDETIMQTVEFLKQQQQSAEERLQQLQDDKQRLVLERDAAVREATEARAQVRNLEELAQRSIPPKVHRKQLDEVEGRVRQLREEVITLKAQLQDAETRSAAVSSAGENKEAELEALQEQVSDLQSSLTEAQEKLAVQEELSKQWELRIQQLREKNECVEKAEYDKLQQELEKAKKQLSSPEFRKGNPAVNRLQKQMAEMKQKHAAEVTEVKNAGTKKWNEVVRKYNAVCKANTQTKKELEELKASTASLKQQLTEQEQDHSRQLASRGKELDELKAAELTLKAQLQAQQELQAQMNTRLEAARKQVDQALADSVDKGRELDKLSREKALLVGQIHTLRGEKQSLLQQLQARPPVPPPSTSTSSQTIPGPSAALPAQAKPAHPSRPSPPVQPSQPGPNHTRIPVPPPTQQPTSTATPPAAAASTQPPGPSAQLPTTSTQPATAKPAADVVQASPQPPSSTPPSASTAAPVPPQNATPATSSAPTARLPHTAGAPAGSTGGAPAATPEVPTVATTAAARKLEPSQALTSTPVSAVTPAPADAAGTTATDAAQQPAAAKTPAVVVQPPVSTVPSSTVPPATSGAVPSTTTATAGVVPPSTSGAPSAPTTALPSLRASRPAASEMATSVPGGPAANADAALPPKDPAKLLAMLKARMANKSRKSNAADSATGQVSDSAPSQPAVGELASAVKTASAQQPSPSTKRARIESTDSTGEAQEVGEGEGGQGVAVEAAGAATASPPVAKRQRIPEVPGEGVGGSTGASTPLKGAVAAAVGHTSVLPADAGPPEEREVDTEEQPHVEDAGGRIAEVRADVDMTTLEGGDVGGESAARRLFRGGSESVLNREDKADEAGDVTMEEGDVGKLSEQGLHRAPSEVKLHSEMDEEVIEISDSQMEDVEAAGEQEAGQVPPQPTHTEEAVQAMQVNVPGDHKAASDVPQGGTAPAGDPASGVVVDIGMTEEEPHAADADATTQSASVIGHPDITPAQPDNLISNADAQPPTTTSAPGQDTPAPVSNADAGAHATASAHGLVNELASPEGTTGTPKAADNQQVSEQSLQRFEALHYLTLQLDAKNLSEHNQQLLLGSIPDGMPPYDKPLLYLSTDRAHEAGMSLPEATEALTHVDTQPQTTEEPVEAPAAAAAAPHVAATSTEEVGTFTAKPVESVPTHSAEPPLDNTAGTRTGDQDAVTVGHATSILSPAAAPFVPTGVGAGAEAGAGDPGVADAEVGEQEEEQPPPSPTASGLEGEEPAGEVEVMDLVDDDDEDHAHEEEEDDGVLAGDKDEDDDGEIEMEEDDEGAAEGFDEEDGEDGGEDGEILEDGDEQLEEDVQTQTDSGSTMPPPVALSRANTSQVEDLNHPASTPAESAQTPLKTQDSNAHHTSAHIAASPPSQGTRFGGDTHPAGGVPQTGAVRTSSAASPAPSGLGAPGGGGNEDLGGGDGADETEHSSRDPGTRLPRRQIRFELAPRTDAGPPPLSGPPGDGVPRPHQNLPISGRGQQGHPALRGGLMHRGRRGGRLRGRGRQI